MTEPEKEEKLNVAYLTRFMRPEAYAETRGFSIHTVRYWIRHRTIRSLKIGRMITLDPVKADQALAKFERKAVAK
jgi:hypothetical protein